MRIISLDIGIRNLSVCVLSNENQENQEPIPVYRGCRHKFRRLGFNRIRQKQYRLGLHRERRNAVQVKKQKIDITRNFHASRY